MTNTKTGYGLFDDPGGVAAIVAPAGSTPSKPPLGFKESMRVLIGPKVIDALGTAALTAVGLAAEKLGFTNEPSYVGRHEAGRHTAANVAALQGPTFIAPIIQPTEAAAAVYTMPQRQPESAPEQLVHAA